MSDEKRLSPKVRKIIENNPVAVSPFVELEATLHEQSLQSVVGAPSTA